MQRGGCASNTLWILGTCRYAGNSDENELEMRWILSNLEQQVSSARWQSIMAQSHALPTGLPQDFFEHHSRLPSSYLVREMVVDEKGWQQFARYEIVDGIQHC